MTPQFLRIMTCRVSIADARKLGKFLQDHYFDTSSTLPVSLFLNFLLFCIIWEQKAKNQRSRQSDVMSVLEKNDGNSYDGYPRQLCRNDNRYFAQ